MERIYGLIDAAASWWRDRRIENAIKADPELEALRIKSLSFKDGAMHLVMEAPTLVVMTQESARLLELYDAKHYLELKMLNREVYPPRLMRVTLQWDDGESPGDRAARLADELEAVRAERDQLRGRN